MSHKSKFLKSVKLAIAGITLTSGLAACSMLDKHDCSSKEKHSCSSKEKNSCSAKMEKSSCSAKKNK